LNIVSISEASRVLGVSEATLRSWSDNGKIKVFITPGGHRRYNIDDLKDVSKQGRKRGIRELVKTIGGPEPIRGGLARSVAGSSWYRQLTAAQNEELMALGQGMFNLMLRYLTSPAKRNETLEMARGKGSEFGKAVARIGMSLTDSVEAFIQHRAHVMRFVTREFSKKGVQGTRSAEAFSLVTKLMDESLLAMIEAYQASANAHNSGP
jgi:excisionase family DNA binding protein